jgi:hypothetical protein
VNLSTTDTSHAVENIYGQRTSITDLDETLKSSSFKRLRANDASERYNENIFDEGNTSQTDDDENTSVVMADSDEEDDIEHFDVSYRLPTKIDNVEHQTSTIVHSTSSSNDVQPLNPGESVNLFYCHLKRHDEYRRKYCVVHRCYSNLSYLDLNDNDVYDNVHAENRDINSLLHVSEA